MSGKIDQIIKERRAPGLLGSQKGRGKYQPHFDKPNPRRDIPWTLQKMEEAGKFQGRPDLLHQAEVKLRGSQKIPEQTLDYQVQGHPDLDR